VSLWSAFVRTVARHPGVFVFFRSVLENDFKTVRGVIRAELRTDASARTLDLGCGPGTFADVFAGGDYVGVDLDAGYIDHARRTRPGTFVVADARALELPAERFDQVLIHGLFRHLTEADVRSVLAEVRRVVAPGGRVLLVEDIAPVSRANVIGRLMRRLDPVTERRPADDYERLCQEAGTITARRIVRSGVWDYFAAVLSV
jgi:ubiquinone/menaquinone biosynthesis C-methylase UbiE